MGSEMQLDSFQRPRWTTHVPELLLWPAWLLKNEKVEDKTIHLLGDVSPLRTNNNNKPSHSSASHVKSSFQTQQHYCFLRHFFFGKNTLTQSLNHGGLMQGYCRWWCFLSWLEMCVASYNPHDKIQTSPTFQKTLRDMTPVSPLGPQFSPSWQCRAVVQTLDSDLISIPFLLFHFGQAVVKGILLGFLNCGPPPPPVAQMVKILPAMLETQVRSLDQEHPLKKGMANPPIFLPGEFQGQRSQAGYSQWVVESWTWLSD